MPEAIFFDLDGTLIDSEPFWIDAQITSFSDVGVTLTLDLLKQTRGLRVRQVAEYWTKYFRVAEGDVSAIESDIYRRMNEVIHREHAIMPGAEDALRRVQNMGVKLGVVSQSSHDYIQRALEEFTVDMSDMIIKSAEHEPYGKPHPSVYLSAAEQLHIDPTHCLVVEDSLNGVIAAKAARMHCIAIPDHDMEGNPAFHVADKVVSNLRDIDEVLIRQFGVRQ